MNAFYETYLGIIKITYDRKIKKIQLVDEILEENLKSQMTDNVFLEIEQYLEGRRMQFTCFNHLEEIHEGFKKDVLDSLLKIPYGKTSTYKDIAKSIGRDKSYRAVGNALNSNPYPIIYPCHRVLGSDHKLKGFAYGLDTKKKLLDLENAKYRE
ncbi:MAG: methylated-DNA--[protein]-cysteine S-methyltransferase [Anaerococcus sp.]|nr:methylated-DNA--[protein]-cysteine S-methyltransferase [Anaerococcus sp.]